MIRGIVVPRLARRLFFLLLLPVALAGCSPGATVTFTSPADGETGVARDTDMRVEFSTALDSDSVTNSSNYEVRGSVSGTRQTSATYQDEDDKHAMVISLVNSGSFGDQFAQGELVTVSLTNRITSTGLVPIDSDSFSFTISGVAVNPGDGVGENEFVVTSTSPAANAPGNLPRSAVTATFDQAFRESTARDSVFVRGETSGAHDVTLSFAQDGTIEGTSRQLTANLTGTSDNNFLPGERVWVTLTSDLAAPRPGSTENAEQAQEVEIPEGTPDALRELIENATGQGNQNAAATGDRHLRPHSLAFQIASGRLDLDAGSLQPPLALAVAGAGPIEPLLGGMLGDYRPVSDGLELMLVETTGRIRLFRQEAGLWQQLDDLQLLDEPVAMAQGDVDLDGHPELAVVSGDRRLFLVEYVGTELKLLEEPITEGDLTSGDVAGLEIADFDSDGRLDFAVSQSNGLAILRQVDLSDEDIAAGSTLRLEVVPIDVPGGAEGTGAIEYGDFDEDGRIDLVVASGGDRTLRLLRNLGELEFLAISELGNDTTGQFLAADLEGDGDLDVLNATSNGIRFFVHPGTVPVPVWDSTLFSGEQGELVPAAFAVGNLDGDPQNRNDLVTYEHGISGTLTVWVRDANGLTKGAATTYAISGSVENPRLLLGDANDDEGIDVLLCGAGTGGSAHAFSALTSGVIGVSASDFVFHVPETVDGDAAASLYDVTVSGNLGSAISAFTVALDFDEGSLALDNMLAHESLPGASTTPRGSGILTVETAAPIGPGNNIPLATFRFGLVTPALGSFPYLLRNDLVDAANQPRPNAVVVASSLATVQADIVSVNAEGSLEITSSIPAVTDLACTQGIQEGEGEEEDTEIVELTWVNNFDYTQIEITRNGALLATLPGAPDSFTDFSPVSGTGNYRVSGFSGSSPAAAASCTISVVRAPDGFECERVNSTQVQLSWTASASYQSFRVRRDGNLIATLGSSQFSYLDTPGDQNGHLYALAGVQNSNESPSTTCEVADDQPLVTAPPRNQSAVRQGFNTIRVSWVNGENYDEARGIILARTGPAGTTEFDLAGSTTSYIDPDLAPGLYHYAISGVAGGVESSAVLTQDVQALLPPPTDLLCALPGGNDVHLTWTNNFGYDEVIVYATEGSVVTEEAIAGAATSFTLLDLPNGDYSFEVRGHYFDGTLDGVLSSASNACSIGIHSSLRVETLDTAPGLADEVMVVSAQLVDTLEGFRFVLEYDGARFQVPATAEGGPFVEFPALSGALPEGAVVTDSEQSGSSLRLLRVEIPGGLAIPGGADVVLAEIHGSIPADFGLVGERNLDLRAEEAYFTYTGLPEELVESERVVDGELRIFGDVVYIQGLIADPGETIEVPVFGTYDQALGAYTTVVSFDPSLLTLIEITNEGTVAEDLGILAPFINNEAGTGLALVFSTGDSIAADFNQVLAYYVFEVDAAAPVGTLAPLGFGAVVTTAATTQSAFFTSLDGQGGFETIDVGDDIGELLTLDGVLSIGGVLPPSGLLCTAEVGSATLGWTNPDAYDSIRVLRNGILIATLAGSDTSFTDGDAPAGLHTYALEAVVGAVTLLAIECQVQVPLPVVLPVTDLVCSLAGGNALLEWTNGDVYTSIRILREGVEIAALAADAISFEDVATPSGSTRYEVIGMDGDTGAPEEDCTVVKSPAPPSGLDCMAEAGNVVELTWQNGEVYAAVRIERDGATVHTALGNVESHSDLGVPAGDHVYLVRGLVDGVASDPSEECSVTVEGEPTPPVTGLACEQVGESVELNWTNGSTEYDAAGGIIIRRDDAILASLPGDSISFSDDTVTEGLHNYSVSGTIDGSESAPAACEVEVEFAPPPPEFVRGDVDGDGTLGLVDSTLLLDYITGLAGIDCIDAGDVNDDGRVQLVDGIALLDFLFGDTGPPPPPYPDCGPDPTGDVNGDLGCIGPVAGCPVDP